MSTTSINSSTANGRLQLTGLASGLDTNGIVNALISLQRRPITNMTNSENRLNAQSSQLTSIQTALRNLSLSAKSLASPALFASTQQVTSTNPAILGATAAGSVGAVVGGYSVVVNNLASASQKTFSFASPSADTQLQIDGGTAYTVKAGSQVADLVNQINSDSSATVWATNQGGSLVLSDRATGAPTTAGQYINVTVGAGQTNPLTMTSQTDGVNANLTVNGKSYTNDKTNTITDAIPGVTLSLNGITGSTPISVNVAPPAPSSGSVISAVQSFIQAYNGSIGKIQTQLTQKTSATDNTQGTLFGDADLTGLLGRMRGSMYSSDSTQPTGFQSLADIGISTGAATGGTATQSSISGQLTLNTDKLTQALTNNPNAVKSLLQKFGAAFTPQVDAEAAAGNSLDARINGNNSEVSDLGRRINVLNEMLTTRQNQLLQTYAKLEAAMSSSQSQGSWLASQINGLPGFR